MKCPKCKSTASEEDKYCNECGIPLKKGNMEAESWSIWAILVWIIIFLLILVLLYLYLTPENTIKVKERELITKNKIECRIVELSLSGDKACIDERGTHNFNVWNSVCGSGDINNKIVINKYSCVNNNCVLTPEVVYDCGENICSMLMGSSPVCSIIIK